MQGPNAFLHTSNAKATDSRATLRTLLHYLEPYRLQILAVIVFASLSSIFSIVGP